MSIWHDTKVRGRSGVRRCGPSRRRARTASAVFKIFVLHPKKTFATISVKRRPDGPEVRLPLYPRKRTQLGHRAMSEKCQEETHASQQKKDAIRSPRQRGRLA